ncbi:MAG: hypothetical protein ACK518_04225 [bacterium]
MATDQRRESHISELRKDLKHMNGNVEALLLVMTGTPLNGNKGVVQFLDKIEKRMDDFDSKVKILNDDNILTQERIDNVKFWGKWIAGVVGAITGGSFLMVLKFISEKQ